MFIKTIGRFDKSNGPLTNHSDGGEGNSGHSHSIETRIKLSYSNRKSKKPRCRSTLFKKNKLEEKEKIELLKNNASKNYIIIFPDQKEKNITNLKKFCEENGLNYSTMLGVSKGRIFEHKGFRCYLENRKNLLKNKKGKNYTYEVISPDNNHIIVTNLKKFCYENKLDYAGMLRLSNNKYKSKKGHLLNNLKGWKINFLNK